MDLGRLLVIGLTVVGLTGAVVHCGGASADAWGDTTSPGTTGTSNQGGTGGRSRWDGDPSGGALGGAGGLDAGTAVTQPTDGPAAADAGSFCPGVSRDPKVLHLTAPRARATGSPTQARGVLLGDGQTPPAAPDGASIRPDEFLNYYQGAGEKVSALGVTVGVRPGVLPTELLLQITLQAPPAPPRGPTVITAVVDTSISMTGAPFARAKASAQALLAALHPGDTFVLVTSHPDAAPAVFSLTAANLPAAQKAIDALSLASGDDLAGALVTAYAGAVAQRAVAGLNRVALITDGGIPVSILDLGLISSNAEKLDIGLVGVGVGSARTYDDTALSYAAAAGRGADLYIDSPDEAKAMLTARFDEVMNVAARDISLTVTLPWHLSASQSSTTSGGDGGGGGGGLVATDLGPGRSLIFRQTLTACSPFLDITDGTIEVDLSYTPPQGMPTTLAGTPTATGVLLTQAQAEIARADTLLAFADALQTRDLTRAQAVQATAGGQAYLQDPDFTAPTTGIRALIAAEIAQLTP